MPRSCNASPYGASGGAPRSAGFYTHTGEVLTVELRWPGGFFVWNTPIAVRVQRRGHTAVQRVYDMTRLAQLAFVLIAVILVLVMRQERKQPSA